MTRWSKFRSAVVAALAGGSVFGACEARLKDAVVGGSTSYLLSPTGLLADIGFQQLLDDLVEPDGDIEATDDDESAGGS